MDHPFVELIQQYGIYAVFLLCTVEGDITLLISGVMAHGGFFGPYGFFYVLLAGTTGGLIGDLFGYWVGRMFHKTVKGYRYYQLAQPRIERIVDKFGFYSVILSKYIYGIRVAMCLFYGIGRMPLMRFILLDTVSCFVWTLLLAGVGYFFSGAITSVIGEYKSIGIALFFIVMVLVILFYVIERYWLSEKVEDADPETLQKIEDLGKTTLHDLGERLHLTRDHNRSEIRDALSSVDERALEGDDPFEIANDNADPVKPSVADNET